ncbi:MAG: DUF1289 domain-containing protein [Beijerinckiaceae bacterium]
MGRSVQDSTITAPEAAPSPNGVPASPCVGVCRLDDRQVCVGCGRHIVEIAAAGVAAERTRARKLQES